MIDQTEPDIIPPEQARAILKQAITDELGADWNADDSNWIVVSRHDYMASLNKGNINLNFFVDYFDGSVKIEAQEIHVGQDTGRLFAGIMIVLFTVIMIVLARGLGYI